jgi:phosphopantetheinyl transferase
MTAWEPAGPAEAAIAPGEAHVWADDIGACGTLRRLLGAYLGCEGDAIALAYTDKGKPFLVAPFGADTLRFNVSHAGDVALFAFSRSADLGVDVEQLSERRDLRGIAHFFSAAERACVRAAASATCRASSTGYGRERRPA